MLSASPARLSGSISHAEASAYYQLVQYPGAGFAGFYGQIADADSAIDMEMYELDDATAERDLAAAAARGVRVRVLLDKDFGGEAVNRGAARYLAAHGVEVRWAPPGYIFHIKVTTFDGTTSDISTANLVSKYYPTSRDAEIIDSNPVQVHAIEETFSNDWNAGASASLRSQTVQAPGLIWSPNTGSGTAEVALVAEISSARVSVDLESEELSDPVIYQALAADATRGVTCRVLMTRASEWYSAYQTITEAGCHVRLFPDSATGLYIHEKLILDDGGLVRESLLIGSQNASVTSLTRNRELGIIVTRAHGGASTIAAAATTFDWDYNRASPWSLPEPIPTPTTPTPTPTTPTLTTAPPTVPTPPATPTPPTPAPAACYPLASSGNCYEPGEYCSDADHGLSGIAGDGEAIVCEDNDGWRWEPE